MPRDKGRIIRRRIDSGRVMIHKTHGDAVAMFEDAQLLKGLGLFKGGGRQRGKDLKALR